jgi:hypothetical protein
MSVDRQDEATARAVEMFTQWVKSNDLDALLAAYARGEITDERIINEIAVRYQRGIGSAVQALAEHNKAAAQQIGERLKGRIDEMLDGLARRDAAAAAQKPRAKASGTDTLKDRDDAVLLREHLILSALSKTNAALKSAEIFEHLRKFDASLQDDVITAHLARLHKAGMIGKQGKGRYHSAPGGAVQLLALASEIEARALPLPAVQG